MTAPPSGPFPGEGRYTPDMNRYRFFQAARRATVLLAVVASVGGCATKRDIRDIGVRMDDLAAQQVAILDEMQRQGIATQDTLRGTTQELNDIRGDVARQLNVMTEALDRLTEMVGGNSRSLSSIRDQIDQLRRSGVATQRPAQIGPGGDTLDVRTNRGESADVAYNTANRMFNTGSNTSARIAFQDFLAQYPRDELAPSAHFKLGDIFYQEEELGDAYSEFSRIPELFPTDLLVPDAYYRMASIRIDEGENGEARQLLQRILNSYPDASVAPLARERLDEIGGDAAKVLLHP